MCTTAPSAPSAFRPSGWSRSVRPPTPLFQGGGPVCRGPSSDHGIVAGAAVDELLRVSANASTAPTTTSPTMPPMIHRRRLPAPAGFPSERTGGGALGRGAAGAPDSFFAERLATVGDRTSGVMARSDRPGPVRA